MAHIYIYIYMARMCMCVYKMKKKAFYVWLPLRYRFKNRRHLKIVYEASHQCTLIKTLSIYFFFLRAHFPAVFFIEPHHETFFCFVRLNCWLFKYAKVVVHIIRAVNFSWMCVLCVLALVYVFALYIPLYSWLLKHSFSLCCHCSIRICLNHACILAYVSSWRYFFYSHSIVYPLLCLVDRAQFWMWNWLILLHHHCSSLLFVATVVNNISGYFRAYQLNQATVNKNVACDFSFEHGQNFLVYGGIIRDYISIFILSLAFWHMHVISAFTDW